MSTRDVSPTEHWPKSEWLRMRSRPAKWPKCGPGWPLQRGPRQIRFCGRILRRHCRIEFVPRVLLIRFRHKRAEGRAHSRATYRDGGLQMRNLIDVSKL